MSESKVEDVKDKAEGALSEGKSDVKDVAEKASDKVKGFVDKAKEHFHKSD